MGSGLLLERVSGSQIFTKLRWWSRDKIGDEGRVDGTQQGSRDRVVSKAAGLAEIGK